MRKPHYTPDGRLISSELPDGTSRYYLTDVVGSVVAVSGASSFTAKYSYDPYGNTRSTSGGEAGSNPFRYTGAYTDAAAGGLYKMGARYYDPTTGRFTQPDPSGQEVNAFAYGFNNPINFVDPSGLLSFGQKLGVAVASSAAGLAGGVVGGTIGSLGGPAGAAVGAYIGAKAASSVVEGGVTANIEGKKYSGGDAAEDAVVGLVKF